MHYKISTNVPATHIDTVRQSMGNVQGGVLGKYTHCAFVSSGTGYFLPGIGTNPYIGSIGTIESVSEYKLEMVCEDIYMHAVIQALRASHPYEEPPIEIYRLEDVADFI